MINELDPRLVFDRFVVGPANRLAAAAARRAAESRGVTYNPLVICGPTGLGKTHLLMAIGHLARAVEPELYVHYETTGSFVDRLSESIAAGTLAELRRATGGVGLLLLDDLQQASGRARTQFELLRLWEAMIRGGAQVVIAADRPPHQIPDLDPRLANRLAGGLIVEIAAPEAETRLGIVEQLLREGEGAIPDEIARTLAALPLGNVRELQGALHRVVAAVEVEGRALVPADLAGLLGVADAPAIAPGDEFGAFLSDISTAVAAVVETDPWRRRIASEILRWESEGVRTHRLEAALDADTAPDVDALLADFAREVEASRRPPVPQPPSIGADPHPPTVDPFFLDREKLALDWVDLDERVMEERG